MIYRITEQESRVIERSYDLEVTGPFLGVDEAQHVFESLNGSEKAALFVHEEYLSMNVEITGVEAT